MPEVRAKPIVPILPDLLANSRAVARRLNPGRNVETRAGPAAAEPTAEPERGGGYRPSPTTRRSGPIDGSGGKGTCECSNAAGEVYQSHPSPSLVPDQAEGLHPPDQPVAVDAELVGRGRLVAPRPAQREFDEPALHPFE